MFEMRNHLNTSRKQNMITNESKRKIRISDYHIIQEVNIVLKKGT